MSRKILTADKAVGKLVYCSLGYVILGIEAGDSNSNLTSIIIKTSDRFKIGTAVGQVSTIKAPYVALTKKEKAKIAKHGIDSLDTEVLRLQYEIADRESKRCN